MLLALDTASPAVSVALVDVDEGLVVRGEATAEEDMRHAELTVPLVERVLAEAGAERFDVTAVVVGVGPGPFTGLRVGLVTARTLGHVLQVPVYGVCSLDALAAEAVDRGTVAEPFVVATDARRREVYVAGYDEAGTRVEGPAVARPADVATDRPVVGEGALLYPDHLPDARAPRRPSAAWLARVVAQERVELLDPEPLYLRRPDAVARPAS